MMKNFADFYRELSHLDFLEPFNDGTTFKLKDTIYYLFATPRGCYWFYNDDKDLVMVDFITVLETVEQKVSDKMYFYMDIFSKEEECFISNWIF